VSRFVKHRRVAAGRAFLLSTTVLVLTAALGGSSAQARWGNEKCSLQTHCYAVTSVNVNAKGGVAYIQEESANVPEWAAEAFVDDEMWVSFPAGGWLEIGLTAGWNPGPSHGDCCTLHPFIAHAEYVNSAGKEVGYEEYVWYLVNANSLIHTKIEDPYLDGKWCEYIWNGPTTWETVDCHSKPGWWTIRASHEEAGLEASSNNSKPYNGARQEVAQVVDGGGWLPWTGAASETVNAKLESVAGVMCIRRNPCSEAAGNAQYWVC
jgi:hypothetical protein